MMTLHKPNAFSLIELLVVIAVIAILAALLLPALSRATSASRYARWQGYHKDIARDPSVELLYGFSEGEGETLRNEATGDVDDNPATAMHETRNLDIKEAPEWTNGHFGKNPALRFDGVDDYAQAQGYLGFNGKRTVAAWIKAEGDGFITSWGRREKWRKWAVGVSSGRLHGEVQEGSTTGTASLMDGEWHHVVVCHDGETANKLKLYVDGTPDPKSSASYGFANTSELRSPFRIGADASDSFTSAPPGGFFNGIIDELIIYNRSLSEAEVKGAYEMGKP